MPFADYVREAVVAPLGLGLDPGGHPGAGMHGSLEDVLAIGRELLSPRLVAAETHEEMASVQFPGLDGVLPDFGRFRPLDWGLGVELKGDKEGHWSGTLTSPRTFGHFGGSGTFLWVDPDRGVACAALDDAAVRRLGEGGVAAALGRRVSEFGGTPSNSLSGPAGAGVTRPCRSCRCRGCRRRRAGASSSSNVARSQLATTDGSIAVTVAVRGMPIASATSPKVSPGRSTERVPRPSWVTLAMPERRT